MCLARQVVELFHIVKTFKTLFNYGVVVMLLHPTNWSVKQYESSLSYIGNMGLKSRNTLDLCQQRRWLWLVEKVCNTTKSHALLEAWIYYDFRVG